MCEKGGGVHVCVPEVSKGFVCERRDGVAEREEERCFSLINLKNVQTKRIINDVYVKFLKSLSYLTDTVVKYTCM